MSGNAPSLEGRPRRLPRRRIAVVLFAALVATAWLAAVAGGFTALLRYEKEPGRPGEPPGRWPAGTPLALDPERATLLLFAHPRCPCTKATLEELDRLATGRDEVLTIRVLVYAEPALGESWTRGPTWERASAIPGVAVEEDAGGELASRFGVQTSGHVLLYAPDGTLVFSGGITSARGHEGPNEGTRAISSWLARDSSGPRSTPVYGCGIECAPDAGAGGEKQ